MQITKPRVIAYVISCLLPLAVIGLGIYLLLNHTLFGMGLLVVMIIFPLVAGALLFPVVFSKLRVSTKAGLVVLLLVVFSVQFLFGFAMAPFEELYRYDGAEAIEHFEEEARWRVLPTPEEAGRPEEIEYLRYISTGGVIFCNEVHALIFQYTEPEYEAQKKLLEEKYVFQTEPMTARGYSVDPAVTIDGYRFRTLAIDGVYGSAVYYPKYLAFAAVNDETREIVYLTAYDDDLDYIVSLADFLTECGWKHMR